MQDHTGLFGTFDFAGAQGAAVRQHLEITGQVGFPERDIDDITAFSRIQLRHGLHHTRRQEGITQRGLLDDVRSENLGDDDIRAKSRHDEFSKTTITVGRSPYHQRSRFVAA